jgi:hypothetical protein
MQSHRVISLLEKGCGYTRDTTEGFAYYLIETTDDLEGRIKAGEEFDVAARKTIDRKLLTAYSEFQRQLASKDQRFWSKIFAAGSKILRN